MGNKISATIQSFTRNDFQLFAESAFLVMHPNESYVPGPHIDAICWHLGEVLAGRMPRLIVNEPPRSLKSFIISVAFPAFILGHDPTASIICVSYGDGLATSHARRFRELIDTPFYRGLFPRVRISQNTENLVVTSKGGFRIATSVGGTLTGEGADYIIVDDPIKADAAHSPVERDRVNTWWNHALVSRLNDQVNGHMILVMQRVHAFDSTGFLLDADPSSWTHLCLPAEFTEDTTVQIGAGLFHTFPNGSLLDSIRLPRQNLEQLARQLGSNTYSAQYLQNPVPPDGTIIKKAWFRYYDPKSPPRYIQIIQSWDVAGNIGTNNDWSVCVTLGITKNSYDVIDVRREKVTFSDLVRIAQEMAQQYQPNLILIEEASNGISLRQYLERQTRLHVVKVVPVQHKEARVNLASAAFQAGRVRFAKDAIWGPPLERELLDFPGGRYDDQVDALVQALNWASEQNADYDLTTIMVPIMLKDEADRFFRDADFS